MSTLPFTSLATAAAKGLDASASTPAATSASLMRLISSSSGRALQGPNQHNQDMFIET
jgi:hypothetical protein